MSPAGLFSLDWGVPCPAPAKLNLFLHITGRRADGYHCLQTVFCLLDRCDVLHFYPRQDEHIVLRQLLPGVEREDDLCFRAARLLQHVMGRQQGVEIALEKRLPMGGGLGGGSSDAATVLMALNQLWGCGLSRDELQTLGLRLGADVPFFIFGESAFAQGIGEELVRVDLPQRWYLVLEPPVSVPTALIFSDPNLCRNTPPLSRGDWQPGAGHNDLEAVACRLFPVIQTYLDWLATFSPARMTGSGACVFAEFDDPDEAHAVLDRLPSTMRGWVTTTLSSHPLSLGDFR